ncbi:MAG: hypothetical protein M3081_00065 [Gemmatimonadota bacterium]|nr:hypothetical protein [Gemmatimonadota bacterium]
MLFGFIGRVSSANMLREGLDVGSQRVRSISARVAQATLKGADGFALKGQLQQNGQPGVAQRNEPVDLETEMVSLADEQLHYEATSKLLEKAYTQIRTALRDK